MMNGLFLIASLCACQRKPLLQSKSTSSLKGLHDLKHAISWIELGIQSQVSYRLKYCRLRYKILKSMFTTPWYQDSNCRWCWKQLSTVSLYSTNSLILKDCLLISLEYIFVTCHPHTPSVLLCWQFQPSYIAAITQSLAWFHVVNLAHIIMKL